MGKDKSHRSYIKYTKYRNLFNRIKRTQKQNYFNEQFSKFRHNAKMTWSVINEVIGRNNDKLSPVDCFKIKMLLIKELLQRNFVLSLQMLVKNMPVRYLMLSINIVIICVTQIKITCL